MEADADMRSLSDNQFYHSNMKWETFMAIVIGFAVCLIRISTAASEVFFSIAALSGIYLWLKNGRRLELNEDAKKYIKVVFIMFLATSVSIIDVDNKLFVFEKLVGTWLWRFIEFILIVAFVKKRKYLLTIFTGFIAAISIDCILACYQFFILHWERGKGFHGDYLDLTAIICMVLAMSAIVLLDSHIEKKIRIVGLVGVICSLAGLFGCFGRGAFLVTALVLPFYLIYYVCSYVKRNTKIAVVIIVVLCCLGVALISSPKYTARLSTTFNTTTNISNVDRIWAWKSSLDMFLDYPVNGVGFNNWGMAYRDEGYKYAQESQNLPHAHSNYMQILAETGTIGFVGFMCFYLFFLIYPAKRWVREHNPYDLVLFTTFLGCMVLFGAFQPTYLLSAVIRTLWFIQALMIQLRATTIYPREDEYT